MLRPDAVRLLFREHLSHISSTWDEKGVSPSHPELFLPPIGTAICTFLMALFILVRLLLLQAVNCFWIPADKISDDDASRNFIKNKEDGKVCLTNECKEAAESILNNLNTSANPCTEFFEFACGGWKQRHPVPMTDSHWNQFNEVDHLLTLQLKELLESDGYKEDPQPVMNARKLYQSCLIAGGEDASLDPLLEVIGMFGGWPMTLHRWNGRGFNWQMMLADIIRDYSIAPIFSIYAQVDRKNSLRRVLTVDQGSLSLPRSMHTDPAAYRAQRAALKEWIVQTATLIANLQGSIASMDSIISQAEEIIALEAAIAKLGSPNEMRRNVLRTYNPMTLRELQDWTDLSAKNQVSWLDVMNRLLLNSSEAIDWSHRVIVREVDYIFKAAELISQTPLKVISNFLHWRLVKNLGPDISQPLRRLAFKFEQVFTGATLDQPRWKECVTFATSVFGMAVGYSYVKAHFDVAAKRDVEEMLARIKSALSLEIDKLAWMDSETKFAAKNKVSKMSQMIGYPSWITNHTALSEYYKGLETFDYHWKNVLETRQYNGRKMFKKLKENVDRNEWPIPPAVVNAYYNPQGNSIIFPAGILQPPFFKRGRPESLNFGGIGVVIGHEITHGFDDVGRQSDGDGLLSQWWSDKTIEAYEGIADCFISQYSRYRLPQLDMDLLKPATVNGAMTQGENMADNGGLRLAFLALHHYLTDRGPDDKLPGLEQYSTEQLFFISFATNWCESATKQSLLQEILSDPHSPHKFRVEGTLSNSEDFAAAFNCPASSTHETCSIW